LGLAAFGFSVSSSYGMLAAFSVLAGVGNGVFHPVDYTLLNRKISASRLGHAYSVHGITGSLGWALAPAMLVPIALAFSWRAALVSAGTLAFAVLAVLWVYRDRLAFHAHTGGVDVLRILFLLRDCFERGSGICSRGRPAVAWCTAGHGCHVFDHLYGVQLWRYGVGGLFDNRPCAL